MGVIELLVQTALELGVHIRFTSFIATIVSIHGGVQASESMIFIPSNPFFGARLGPTFL